MSTSISTDRRLAQLGEQAGPWAVVLYTWAIPHASDDARLADDPEELLSTVAPNLALRGLVTVADATLFIDSAVSLGLLVRCQAGHLCFPESFYRYQSYIGDTRRSADPTHDVRNGEEPRESAHNDADKIFAPEPAQNRSSLTSSSSLKSSLELRDESANADMSANADAAPEVSSTNGHANDPVDAVYEHFKACIQPRSRLCPRKKIAARLKRFSVEELREGIDHFAADSWEMDHNASRGAGWFFESDDRAEHLLLLKPRASPALNRKAEDQREAECRCAEARADLAINRNSNPYCDVHGDVRQLVT